MIGFGFFFVVASAPTPVPTTSVAITAPPMRRSRTRLSLNMWGLPRQDSAQVVSASRERHLPSPIVECDVIPLTARRRRGITSHSTVGWLARVGVPGGGQARARGVRRRSGEQHSGRAEQPWRRVGAVATERAHLHLARLL